MVRYEWTKEMNVYELLGFYRRLEEWSEKHSGEQTVSGVNTLSEKSVKLEGFELRDRKTWRERRNVTITTGSPTVPEMYFLMTEGFTNTGDGW